MSGYRWSLHEQVIEGDSDDPELLARWQEMFASCVPSHAPPSLRCRLDKVQHVPQAPPGEPAFRQDDFLAYYVDGPKVLARFPRFGHVHIDLEAGESRGQVVPAALTTYGVLEDLIAISLSPHLKRRGLYFVHAFAAELEGRAVLLVGGIGAGKTTTGLALLAGGFRMISNDAPLVDAGGRVHPYPGLLAAHPDSFAFFEATRPLSRLTPALDGRGKISAAAESIWPGVWSEGAPAHLLLFPQIGAEAHRLEALTGPEALRLLLPHSVEQWDQPIIPAHLGAMARLVEQARAFRLHLGPDPVTVAEVVRGAL